MDNKIFNVLQDTITINATSASTIHPSGYHEKGYKNQYDMWLLKKGSIQMEYDQVSYELKQGDLFLMYPNTLYEATVVGGEAAEFIYTRFFYTINQLPSVLDNFPIAGHIPFEDYAVTRLKRRVDDFVESFDAKKEDGFLSIFITKQYFHIMISSVIEHQLANAKDDPLMTTSYPKLSRLLPVIEYIHEHYNSALSGSELASKADMSEKYFITYFKETLGLSPHQYQIQLRMQKAVAMLHEQCYTIKEISDAVGYRDQYNFSTAFKKNYGVSPSNYLS